MIYRVEEQKSVCENALTVKIVRISPSVGMEGCV